MLIKKYFSFHVLYRKEGNMN